MQLQEGKFYKTRTGDVVGPMKQGMGLFPRPWPFFSESRPGKAWKEDGTYFESVGGEHHLDLVYKFDQETTPRDESFNLDMKDTPANDAVGSNISPTFMRATEIAGRAADLVGGDRDRQHGAKKDNFERIATMWNAWLKTRKDPAAPMSAFDVGILMVLMKVARTQSGLLNIDDFVDAAGYASCAGEIAQLDLTAE